LKALRSRGVKKINFAGGEPTLVPFLGNLIQKAAHLGFFVSLISNGTGITKAFLDQIHPYINMIGLSIDSNDDGVEEKLGRCLKNTHKEGFEGKFSHVDLIKSRCKWNHEMKIPLKINSVITPLNGDEDFHALISQLNPIRWKVFQVHQIKGVNDPYFQQTGGISLAKFHSFLYRHRDLNPIGETDQLMEDSYCMISPDGRFYQNTQNSHSYSDPILHIGLEAAIQQVFFREDRYKTRKGNYFEY
jgi:radical S-adenosyl methionine domain-containing protein 2